MPIVMPRPGDPDGYIFERAAMERLRHFKTLAAESGLRGDDGLDLAFAPDPTAAGPSGVTGYSWIVARGD